MAWTEKLPSGKHRGVYRDGLNRRRSAGTFSHKAEALRKAGAMEEAARRSLRRDPNAYRRPWGQWADEWEQSRTIEESTKRADEMRRKNHLDGRWSDVPLGAITRLDVKTWAAQLRRDGLGAETVKRCVHLLSASLTAAVDAEILDANPASRLKLPSGALAQERFLTKEEYAHLREQMPTTRDQAIADMLVNTGMRWGELAGLHIARVDSERGILRVIEAYDEAAGVMKPYPKGKRAREVPIPAWLVEDLQALSSTAKACGVRHVSGRCMGRLALTSDEGEALRNSNWSDRVWRPAVKAADIGPVRIHDARHTYASWLLQAGLSLAEVGRLLGHLSTQTTARYAHLADTPTEHVLAALALSERPAV